MTTEAKRHPATIAGVIVTLLAILSLLFTPATAVTSGSADKHADDHDCVDGCDPSAHVCCLEPIE